jgi:hypothetical protein
LLRYRRRIIVPSIPNSMSTCQNQAKLSEIVR